MNLYIPIKFVFVVSALIFYKNMEVLEHDLKTQKILNRALIKPWHEVLKQ